MSAPALSARGSPAPFPPSHPWDRWLFPAMVGMIWLGALMGFIPEMADHFARREPAYPPILHVHAAVMVGWLTLLSAQTMLIRTNRWALHRRLGLAGAALAPLVFAVGLTTAWTMDRLEFGTAKDNTPFLFVQTTDMLAFAGLTAAGLLLRADGPAHKRLMLLATLYISDAGYSRWIGTITDTWIGEKPLWPYFTDLYPNDLLILGLGAYDLVTRRRLHPAYVVAVLAIAAIQLVSVQVRWDPAWRPIAARLLGH